MEIYINIKWDDTTTVLTRSLVEQLIGAGTNASFAYDADSEDFLDDVCKILDDHDIDYELVKGDI